MFPNDRNVTSSYCPQRQKKGRSGGGNLNLKRRDGLMTVVKKKLQDIKENRNVLGDLCLLSSPPLTERGGRGFERKERTWSSSSEFVEAFKVPRERKSVRRTLFGERGNDVNRNRNINEVVFETMKNRKLSFQNSRPIGETRDSTDRHDDSEDFSVVRKEKLRDKNFVPTISSFGRDEFEYLKDFAVGNSSEQSSFSDFLDSVDFEREEITPSLSSSRDFPPARVHCRHSASEAEGLAEGRADLIRDDWWNRRTEEAPPDWLSSYTDQ